jgi:hypothetical protein
VRLAVTGQLFDPSGYGEFGRLIAWALHDQGHEVFARCWNAFPEEPGRFGRKGELVKTLLRESPENIDANVIVYAPIGLKRLCMPGVPNVTVTMTESDHMPAMYAYELNRLVDSVLVPSAWNQRLFQADVDKKVSCIPRSTWTLLSRSIGATKGPLTSCRSSSGSVDTRIPAPLSRHSAPRSRRAIRFDS